MKREQVKQALSLANRIQSSLNSIARPPSEVQPSIIQPVIPNSLFNDTRGYLLKIVYQINRTYDNACYDACAVMIRRLVEILIIESFEKNNISDKIKNSDDNYFYLDGLINQTIAENSWSLGRNTKAALKKFKKIGDLSAHSRRYNTRREYIDDIIIDLRTCSEELLYIAGLKK